MHLQFRIYLNYIGFLEVEEIWMLNFYSVDYWKNLLLLEYILNGSDIKSCFNLVPRSTSLMVAKVNSFATILF